MEDTAGYSLCEILATYRRRGEGPPFPLALAWLEGACRSLRSLHAAGGVHGGVCPASVLVGPEERVQVTGAELPPVLLAERGAASTEGAAASGYLAPEQREGRAVDCRADVYALGLTFYELLTLIYPAPLVASGAAPRPPSTLNATVPPAFDALLARMMARWPEDRFASAEEVLAALRDMNDGALGPPAAEAWPAGLRTATPAAVAGPVAVPRAGLIAAGAFVGVLAGACAAAFLSINVLAAILVGSIVGALVGCFVNPKV